SLSCGRTLPRAQVQHESGKGLRILELRQQGGDPGDRNPHDLDLLVALRFPLRLRNAFGEIDADELVAEARCREERGCEVPVATEKARLLLELSLGRRKRLLASLARAGGKVEQPLPRRLAELAHERYVPASLDGDDRNRARVADDLAVVVAPLLDVDADQTAVVGAPGSVRPHASSRAS